MKAAGRPIVAFSLLAALAVVAAGVAQHEAIVDWWWLQKLESPDEAIWHRAAEKLAERKSLRAVPHLLRIIRERPDERIAWSGGLVAKHLQLTPAAYALYRIGPEADPLLPSYDGPIIDEEPRVFSVVFFIRKAWHLGSAAEVNALDP